MKLVIASFELVIRSIIRTANTGARNDDRRVDATIKGPDTEFVYSMEANSRSTNVQGRRLAAILNRLAGRRLSSW